MQIDSEKLIKWLESRIEELEKESKQYDYDDIRAVGFQTQIQSYKEIIEHLKFCDMISKWRYCKSIEPIYPPIRPPEQPKYPNTYTSSKGTGKRWDDEQ